MSELIETIQRGWDFCGERRLLEFHVPRRTAPLTGLSSHLNLNLSVNLSEQYGVPPCVLPFLKSFASFADDPLMPVDTFSLPCL